MTTKQQQDTEGTVANTEALAGLILTDSLIPERFFYHIYGGRTKFSEWRQKGLTVYYRNGRPCYRPSELKAFIDSLEG